MAKRRNGRGTSGGAFGKILLTVVILAVVIFLALRLVNSCSDCEKTFFGLGYEGNVIDNAVDDEEEQILCEGCAERHYALSLFAGKELDEYKRVLVPGKMIPGEVKFGAESDK